MCFYDDWPTVINIILKSVVRRLLLVRDEVEPTWAVSLFFLYKFQELSLNSPQSNMLKASIADIDVPNPLNPTDMQSFFLQEVQLGEELMAAG